MISEKKGESKSAKWESKWGNRQKRFSRNKSPPWKLRWKRSAAKVAKKFGEIDREHSDEAGGTEIEDFYIASNF